MEQSRSEMEKEMAKEVEKQVTNWVTVAITAIIQVAIMFVIALVLFKVVWAWVVPDLFPGAVTQGLIIEDLSWLAAVKLAVLVGVLGGFSPALTDAFKQRA
jgi:small-conductance mechanosensitive channel